MEDKITLNIKQLLRFFDEKNGDENKSKNVSGIVAFAGEDIGAGLFKHFLERNQIRKNYGNFNNIKEIKIYHNNSVTTGESKGHRLDRWIYVKQNTGVNVLFQTEIKCWTSHGYKMSELKINVDSEEKRRYGVNYWKTIKKAIINKEERIIKVFEEMKPKEITIETNKKPLPLLILWLVTFGGKKKK